MSPETQTLDLSTVLSDSRFIVGAWGQPIHHIGTEPVNERALTAYLVTEEVAELASALAQHDLIETLDALVDIAYVVAGSLVRHDLTDGINLAPSYTPFSDFYAVNLSASIYLGKLAEGDDPAAAREAGVLAVSACAGAVSALGADFAALWNEVHRSNRSKLVQGRPVIDPVTGKASKPATYSPPDLRSVIDRTGYDADGNWWEILL